MTNDVVVFKDHYVDANGNLVLGGTKFQKVKVQFKKLSSAAKFPQYAHKGDAGLDLYATSYEFNGGKHIYGCGLAAAIPEGYVGLLFPRSSICNYDLTLTNCVGVIDSGYRGEIKAVFKGTNHLAETRNVYNLGDRFAQLIIVPIPYVVIEEVEELPESERGEGGYGSTGR